MYIINWYIIRGHQRLVVELNTDMMYIHQTANRLELIQTTKLIRGIQDENILEWRRLREKQDLAVGPGQCPVMACEHLQVMVSSRTIKT